MTSLLIAALLAVPPVHPEAPAVALSDAQIQSRVRAYLGAIDTPIPADRWKALGPRAAAVLTSIANDGNEFPSRRAKAIGGLVIAAPAAAAPVVTRLAQDETQPITVRYMAVRGVARTAPTPQAAALRVGKVLRGAGDPALRGLAAEVVAASGKSGCAQVKAQVAREQAAQLPHFRRALAACGE